VVGLYGMDAVPGVLEMARSDSPRRRAMAFVSIAVFTAEVKQQIAEETIPLLSKGLVDENLDVRRKAASAVRFHGSIAKATMPVQLKVLQEEKDNYVRLELIRGLGAMGEDAKEALPVLEKYESDPDAQLRDFAARSKFFIEGRDKEQPK
jgi:HEAT repeat protein